jgi:hypothetical protein
MLLRLEDDKSEMNEKLQIESMEKYLTDAGRQNKN